MDILARQLKRWRQSIKLTQGGLAMRAGIPRPNLIDLELGRRDCTITTLIRLAEALGITAGKLLDEEPKKMIQNLDRYQRDWVARSILGEKKQLPAHLCQLAGDLRPLFRSAFVANGLEVPKGKRGRLKQRRFHVEQIYGRDLVRAIADRVQKLMPLYL